MSLCRDPNCAVLALVEQLGQDAAHNDDDGAFMMAVSILSACEVIDPGSFYKAATVATLKRAPLADLLAELERRGKEREA